MDRLSLKKAHFVWLAGPRQRLALLKAQGCHETLPRVRLDPVCLCLACWLLRHEVKVEPSAFASTLLMELIGGKCRR